MLNHLPKKRLDYAAEQVHFDWRENAVKEAESYANGSKISERKDIRNTC